MSKTELQTLNKVDRRFGVIDLVEGRTGEAKCGEEHFAGAEFGLVKRFKR